MANVNGKNSTITFLPFRTIFSRIRIIIYNIFFIICLHSIDSNLSLLRFLINVTFITILFTVSIVIDNNIQKKNIISYKKKNNICSDCNSYDNYLSCKKCLSKYIC